MPRATELVSRGVNPGSLCEWSGSLVLFHRLVSLCHPPPCLQGRGGQGPLSPHTFFKCPWKAACGSPRAEEPVPLSLLSVCTWSPRPSYGPSFPASPLFAPVQLCSNLSPCSPNLNPVLSPPSSSLPLPRRLLSRKGELTGLK